MANITDGYNNTYKYETKRWGITEKENEDDEPEAL
jgi:hypothetical protein